jgi:hypothetical protein
MYILYEIADNHAYYIPDSKQPLFVSKDKDKLKSKIELLETSKKQWRTSYEIEEIEELE